MSVEVRIEKLVVEGFEGLDGRVLGRALEAELALRLAAGTLDPEHLAGLGAAPTIPDLMLPAGAGAAAIGRSAARAVSSLLASTPRSRAAARGFTPVARSAVSSLVSGPAKSLSGPTGDQA